MKSIRTNLSVLDTKLLETFLSANDLGEIKVGHYEDRVNQFQVDNKICYLYSERDTIVTTNLMYISLKYGNLEKAFCDFKEKIKQYY